MKQNTETNLKVIRPGHPKFIITDGNLQTTRAGLEVSKSCPPHYLDLAYEMIGNGWIVPLAVVKDNELFWEELM